MLNFLPVSGIGLGLAAASMLAAIVTDVLVDDYTTMTKAMSAQCILYGLSAAFYFPTGKLLDEVTRRYKIQYITKSAKLQMNQFVAYYGFFTLMYI